eukprot:1189171-Prorocentrum_minimum.AAC.2
MSNSAEATSACGFTRASGELTRASGELTRASGELTRTSGELTRTSGGFPSQSRVASPPYAPAGPDHFRSLLHRRQQQPRARARQGRARGEHK